MKTRRGKRFVGFRGQALSGLVLCLMGVLCCLLCFDRQSISAESQPDSSPAPKITVSKTELDFGDIWADEKKTQQLEVRNTGTAPLVISKVQSSCSCTRADVDQRELAPGAKTVMHVKLDASEYSINSVNTKVYVDSNDPLTKRAEVSIHAGLKSEYILEPESLDFGKVKKGSSPHKTVILRPAGHVPVTLLKVETSPELVASIEETGSTTPVSAKDATTAPTSAYRIGVTVKPETPTGKLNKVLSLVTDVKRVRKKEYRISADVVGVECVITPKVVVFGPSAPGESVGTIEVQDDREFEVVRAKSSLEEITCEVKKSPSNKGYSVQLQLTAQTTAGRKVGKIKLEIREGVLSEKREVVVYGEVK